MHVLVTCSEIPPKIWECSELPCKFYCLQLGLGISLRITKFSVRNIFKAGVLMRKENILHTQITFIRWTIDKNHSIRHQMLSISWKSEGSFKVSVSFLLRCTTEQCSEQAKCRARLVYFCQRQTAEVWKKLIKNLVLRSYIVKKERGIKGGGGTKKRQERKS